MAKKDWREVAAVIWPMLTGVKVGQLITYGEIGAATGVFPRNLKYPLDLIQDYCRTHHLPPLTWIVVNAEGKTGGGAEARSEDELRQGRDRVYKFDWSAVQNPFWKPDVLAPFTVVQPPTAEELDAAWEKFNLDWGEVVAALYQLCQKRPGDASRRHTMAKVILVNRTYNARLETKVQHPTGVRAIELIGEFVEAHGQAIHDIVEAIPAGVPLTLDSVNVVVRQHGELTRLLAAHLTEGASMKSFVSKYLHFHRPVVPIYDSECQHALRQRVHGTAQVPPMEGADPDYHEFCLRFLALYEDCLGRDVPASVKKLDALLWQVPTRS